MAITSQAEKLKSKKKGKKSRRRIGAGRALLWFGGAKVLASAASSGAKAAQAATVKAMKLHRLPNGLGPVMIKVVHVLLKGRFKKAYKTLYDYGVLLGMKTSFRKLFYLTGNDVVTSKNIAKMYFDPIFGSPMKVKTTSVLVSKLRGRDTILYECGSENININAPIDASCVSDLKNNWKALNETQKREFNWLKDPDRRKKAVVHSKKASFSYIHWPTRLDYSAAEWCKKPRCHSGAGCFKLCDMATREKHAANSWFFKGTERDIPYTKLELQRYEPKNAQPICKVDVFLKFMTCRTCCCTKGLIVSDKALLLTHVKKGEGYGAICGDWFNYMDTLVGLYMSVMRSSKSSDSSRGFAGNCMAS